MGKAWNISPESIIREFKKCCVLTDINGMSDGMQCNEDHEKKNSCSSEENTGYD